MNPTNGGNRIITPIHAMTGSERAPKKPPVTMTLLGLNSIQAV